MSNDKIVPIDKSKQPFRIKQVGLAAKVAGQAGKTSTNADFDGDPNTAKHRIGLVFDDSGSMSGSKIQDAHEGTEEFIRCCIPKETAISVYPMNMEYQNNQIPLTTKLYSLALRIKGIDATGGTPLFETTKKMLTTENITRGIIFSDGSPNGGDMRFEAEVIGLACEKKIPIDTVFIGSDYETEAIALMKRIAEKTGGIFIHLQHGKANFRTSFKYLSPGYRAMLMDSNFKAKVERGEV